MAQNLLFSGDMLALEARSRLMIGVTAAIAASFIAGCCGGPFSANEGGGCTACADPALKSDCVELDASTDAPSDAADSGTD